MSLRFQRRVPIFPGLTLNLGKSGPTSFSVGIVGAKLTVGRGRAHVTVGVPGTGVFYTKQIRIGGEDVDSSGGAEKADDEIG